MRDRRTGWRLPQRAFEHALRGQPPRLQDFSDFLLRWNFLPTPVDVRVRTDAKPFAAPLERQRCLKMKAPGLLRTRP